MRRENADKLSDCGNLKLGGLKSHFACAVIISELIFTCRLWKVLPKVLLKIEIIAKTE